MKTKNKSVRPNIRKVEKVLANVRKKYDIQNRFLNELDFYRICETEEIMLITPKEVKAQNADFSRAVEGLRKIKKFTGFIVRGHNDLRFIYLRSLFNRKVDIFVAAHELGHYFLAHTGTSLFSKNKSLAELRQEAEADLFAELATGKQRKRKT